MENNVKPTGLYVGNKPVVNKDTVLARIKELEEEYIATPKPILGVNSVEDVDELYQAKLEYNWWLDEIQTEYKTLCASIGHLNGHIRFNQYQ